MTRSILTPSLTGCQFTARLPPALHYASLTIRRYPIILLSGDKYCESYVFWPGIPDSDSDCNLWLLIYSNLFQLLSKSCAIYLTYLLSYTSWWPEGKQPQLRNPVMTQRLVPQKTRIGHTQRWLCRDTSRTCYVNTH